MGLPCSAVHLPGETSDQAWRLGQGQMEGVELPTPLQSWPQINGPLQFSDIQTVLPSLFSNSTINSFCLWKMHVHHTGWKKALQQRTLLTLSLLLDRLFSAPGLPRTDLLAGLCALASSCPPTQHGEGGGKHVGVKQQAPEELLSNHGGRRAGEGHQQVVRAGVPVLPNPTVRLWERRDSNCQSKPQVHLGEKKPQECE